MSHEELRHQLLKKDIEIAQRLSDTVEVIKNTYAHLYEDKNNDKAKNILN